MINNDKRKGFIKESYKGKKKKGLLKKVLQTVLFGVLAGAAATIVFVVFTPMFMRGLNPNREEQVIIQTENTVDENEQSDMKQEEKENGKTENNGLKEELAQHTEEDNQNIEKKQPTIVEKKVSLDIKDYKKLYSDFGTIVKEVKKSVVEIVIEKSNEGLIPSVEKHSNIGLIVAENKKSFFILTGYFKDSKSSMKAVIEENVSPVNIAGYDENTGIMVVKLNKSELSKELYDKLEVAQLAHSGVNDVGAPVIVYGNICDGRLGYASGNICSYASTERFMDSSYSMLMSTVVMDDEATGIIIDLEGKVSGFIDKNSKTKYKEAFSMIELNSIIEKLSNGEKIPSLGIKAETVVDKNISKEITNGIFVFEVSDNTPAMDNGILAGDIITKINGINIAGMKQVQDFLKTCKPKQNIRIELMRQKLDKYDKIEIELELK